MNVTIDGLDEEIQRQLKEFNVEVIRTANESTKEAAKEAEKMLKQPGPYQSRTGKYAKGWTAGQREKRKSVIEIQGYTVFNKDKKRYQLTHLLEYGHQSRSGGRVKEFTHIAPVNEQVGEMVTRKIESKLRG